MTAKHPSTESKHLLHVLFAEQQKARFISDTAINTIAASLNLPRSQVEAVVEFYSFFHRQPRGRFDIMFSSCTNCGEPDFMQLLCDRLAVTPGETRGDGLVSISKTSCIGMCDHGASLLLNYRPLISLTPERIENIAKLIESGTAEEKWPKHWFTVDDNIKRKGLLLNESFEAGSALKAITTCSRDEIIREITASKLKGRGGAGFPTGSKWKLCRKAAGDCHYVICNADEGEPGTFKDRVLLNSYTDMVFEGMTLCGYAIGASQGFLYLRGEYRYLLPIIHDILARRREQGLLGNNIMATGFNFDITVTVGAGAYICGEESALIESLEEKRGIPRIRPPFPVTHGYLGQPTVVNNVETMAAAAAIIHHGHRWFTEHGNNGSSGSKLLSVSGDCAYPGIYEYDFGISLQEILKTAGAEDVKAVQIGGPAGHMIGPNQFSRLISFDDLATGGSIMIFGRQRNILSIIYNFSSFFAHESCGFCTPCRVGTRLLKNKIGKLYNGHATIRDINEMKSIASLISRYSHCGLGQSSTNSLSDGLHEFSHEIKKLLSSKEVEPDFDLDSELSQARLITNRDDPGAHL